MTTQIPQGYKQTSIGIIPDDWEVKKMKEIAKVQGGYAFDSRKFTSHGKFQVVKMSNVYNGNLDLERSGSYLPILTAQEEKFKLNHDDILITLTGTIGKRDYGYSYRIIDEENLVLNQRVARLITKKECANPIYLSYEVKTKRLLNQFFFSTRGGTGNQANVGTGDVELLKVALPPLPEQQKIAEILTTWDTAIETCQKTIEQLKQRNRGLAQQLLSGKKRLAGFSDKEWSFVKFKEFYAPNKKPSGNAKFELLSVTKNGIVSQEKYFNKSIASEDTSKYLIVENGDFVVSGLNFWMGSYDVLTDFEIGMVSPAYKVFRLNEKYSKSFFKHLVASRQMKNAMISSSVVGASIVRRNFDLEVLYEYAFKMPGIGEQEAIGNVLDAAQSELKIYEGKLQNLQQQKKGLMQQLLTGKVRTVNL